MGMPCQILFLMGILLHLLEFQIIPNLHKTIRNFSGRESTLDAEKGLDHINGVGDLQKWPVSVRLEAARSSLIDAALNWYACKKFIDWDNFVL